MRAYLGLTLLFIVGGCVHGLSGPAANRVAGVELWRAPAADSDPDSLRIEPRLPVASPGDRVKLELRGALASEAECSSPLEVVLATEGVVDVECSAGSQRAWAQVTFTEGRAQPVVSPYAGGVALFKLRRAPVGADDPTGARNTGAPSLDVLLEALGAWVFPAFPFDRAGTQDRVGLDRWVVVELPSDVNYYQAIALLRADENVHAPSYTPEDAGFLKVEGGPSWPTPLTPVTDPTPPERLTRERRVSLRSRGRLPEPGWAVHGTGAHHVWSAVRGDGVGIAVIDSGVDVNHQALSQSLRDKRGELGRDDIDGNGLPGDALGVNFAHLAIATRPELPPVLALGLTRDLSDWAPRVPGGKPFGHGTALAALAAGAGAPGIGPGVAPAAWLLTVDVERNQKGASGVGAERDPRLERAGSASAGPWSLAAGVVYATAEGARVLTCAWPEQSASWLLHDALLFAEENCVLPVCSLPQAGEPASFPARWRSRVAREAGAGTGELVDAWTGQTTADFYRRPLRALTVVGGGEHADLAARPRTRSDDRAVRSAASNPRNDASALLDARTTEAPSDVVHVALAAGAAALVTQRRPDLDPVSVRAALSEGVRGGTLFVPGALRLADREPEGRCNAELDETALGEAEPFWRRIKVKAKYGLETGGPQDPLGGPKEEGEDPAAADDGPFGRSRR